MHPIRAVRLLALSASAQGIEVPPFDWSTAVWSDQDGGYCNPGGLCAAPRNSIPPGFGQYCTTAWCSFPSWDLGFQLGLYGGIGTGGGACDYSTDCFGPMVGVIAPPAQADCPLAWPICSLLYGGTPTPPPPPATPPVTPPTPTTGECPLNLRVAQQPPAIDASKIAPAYPIVVGQDPTKRGVDVSARIQISPVIVQYDVPKHKHECQYVGGTVTDISPSDSRHDDGHALHAAAIVFVRGAGLRRAPAGIDHHQVGASQVRCLTGEVRWTICCNSCKMARSI